jgi:hypothetical protein
VRHCCCVSIIFVNCISPPGALMWLINLFLFLFYFYSIKEIFNFILHWFYLSSQIGKYICVRALETRREASVWGSFLVCFSCQKVQNNCQIVGGGAAETRVVIIVFNCVLYFVRVILYNILVPFLIFALVESVTSKNYLGLYQSYLLIVYPLLGP